MIQQYRKKPVVIEAVILEKSEASIKSALEFMGQKVDLSNSITAEKFEDYCSVGIEKGGVEIKTLEGVMKASFGDYIIKGVSGEFYPCKPDIFQKTYETANLGSEKLTFGEAIQALKNGCRVCRAGWNGKNMYLIMFKGTEIANKFGYGFGEMQGEFSFVDIIGIKSAQETMVLGWHPSTPDMLSEDWQIIK